MAGTQRRYQAFLLRLWQERREGEWVWYASVEDPHSNVRRGFPNLEHLYAFLQEQTKDSPGEKS